MNALIIDNNFNGAYGSFHVFINEIINTLRKMNVFCFYVSSTEEAIYIYENHSIDFSIGIGQYSNYYNNIPLYEIYKIVHFQWQIDNPLKNIIDFNSFYIQYLVICQDFLLLMKSTRRIPIFVPIGFDGDSINLDYGHQVKGVLFCGQIKALDTLNNKLEASKSFDRILKLINKMKYNNDASFIKEMLNFGINNRDKESLECFSIANSYLRAWSRIKVISSIKKYPVYIIGDVAEPSIIMQNNVHFIGKRDYYDTLSLMRRFKFSLNITPNYTNCLHDRCLRGIVAGSYVITNSDMYVRQSFEECIYSFRYDSSLVNIDDCLFSLSESERRKSIIKSQQYAKKFSWLSILKYIIDRGINNDSS